jgi:hypothetical protein
MSVEEVTDIQLAVCVEMIYFTARETQGMGFISFFAKN